MKLTSQAHSGEDNSSSSLKLMREITLAGRCSNPIRLKGEAVNLATGEVSSSMLKVACKDRRSRLCPACSYLYQADAWILVSAGLIGGKGTPESVGSHPRLFVTLTAPSFGAVHRRTASGGCHAHATSLCRHGHVRRCRQHHPDDSPALGKPLCGDCFDYERAVLWNAQASKLWNRTIQEMRRLVAHETSRARQEEPEATLSFVRVAEFQRRGLVHFHVVLRGDGPGDDILSPPAWLSTAVLSEVVHRVIPHVRWTGADGREIRWGRQFDVISLSGSETSPNRIASYVAKYATKTTDDTLGLARRFRSRRSIEESRVDAHQKRLALTAWDLSMRPEFAPLKLDAHAHTFGFTGQILTKSRRYSTRFCDLRGARAQFMVRHNSVDPIEGTYHYDGRGYDDPRAAEVAEMFHHMRVEIRREQKQRERNADSRTEVTK